MSGGTGGAITTSRNLVAGGSKSLPGNNAVQGFTGGGHHPQNQWGAGDYVNYGHLNMGGLSGWGVVIAAAAQLVLITEQIGLATDYYNTNKQDFDFFENNYKQRMTDHKNQAFTTPFYKVDYPNYIAGALESTKVYDEKWLQSRRRAHRYALGHQRHLDYTYYMLRRKAALAAIFMGRRVEYARKDWKDDQIQTHKVQALNFGITAGNVARQGLAQATGRLESAIDEVGSRVGGFGNGLSEYRGYNEGRSVGTQLLDRSSGAAMIGQSP